MTTISPYRSRRRRGAYLAAASLSIGLLAAAPLTARAQEGAPPPPAAPQPPAAAKVSPEVKALLGKMVAAHQKLNSYSARGDFSFAQGEAKQAQSFDITYEKPNKVRLTITDAETKAVRTIISDGKTLFDSSSEDKTTYRKVDAVPDANNIAGAFGISQVGLGLLPMIITDPQAADKVIPPTAENVKLGADAKVGDVAVTTLSFTLNVGEKPTFTLMVGKEDNLLRKISITGKSQGQDLVLSETFTSVKADPKLEATTFVFTPAPGAKAIGEDGPSLPPTATPPPAP